MAADGVSSSYVHLGTALGQLPAAQAAVLERDGSAALLPQRRVHHARVAGPQLRTRLQFPPIRRHSPEGCAIGATCVTTKALSSSLTIYYKI